jgi:hypothetical protein
MPTYEFQCEHAIDGAYPDTKLIWPAPTREPASCPHGSPEFRRRFTFGGITKGWSGGYNPTIGRYASNEHEVSESLKAASERASEESGTEHRYKAIDPRELAAMKPEKPKPKPINVDKLAAELSKVM